MIVKKKGNYPIVDSYCGKVHDVLNREEYPDTSIVYFLNIEETKPHYHTKFDEIYYMQDGEITIKFYDPNTKKTWEETLKANELCVIRKGIHHKVIKYTTPNRLSVVCNPAFDDTDQHLSDIL